MTMKYIEIESKFQDKIFLTPCFLSILTCQGVRGAIPPPKNPVKKLEGMHLFPILLLLTNLDMITPINDPILMKPSDYK